MSNADVNAVPAWLRVTVWAIAISLAGAGVVLAIVSGSVWPLIAFAGLGLPMFPIGTPRTTRVARPEA